MCYWWSRAVLRCLFCLNDWRDGVWRCLTLLSWFQRRVSAQAWVHAEHDRGSEWIGSVLLRVPAAPATADLQVSHGGGPERSIKWRLCRTTAVCEEWCLRLTRGWRRVRPRFSAQTLSNLLPFTKKHKCRKMVSYEFLTTFIISAIQNERFLIRAVIVTGSSVGSSGLSVLFSPCCNLWGRRRGRTRNLP